MLEIGGTWLACVPNSSAWEKRANRRHKVTSYLTAGGLAVIPSWIQAGEGAGEGKKDVKQTDRWARTRRDKITCHGLWVHCRAVPCIDIGASRNSHRWQKMFLFYSYHVTHRKVVYKRRRIKNGKMELFPVVPAFGILLIRVSKDFRVCLPFY